MMGSSKEPDPPSGSREKTSSPARNSAVSDRREQGGLIDDLTPTGIHEEGARAHGPEERGVEEAPGFFGQSQMDGHDVRSHRHLVNRSGRGDPKLTRRHLVQGTREGDHAHVESPGAADHFPADGTEPQNPNRAPGETARFPVLGLLPDAALQVRGLLGDAPIQGKDQPERQFGHRDRILPRTVRHGNGPRRRGFQVDGVDAGARADNQTEPARALDLGAGDLGRTNDEDIRG
jgi:hypothetical protein